MSWAPLTGRATALRDHAARATLVALVLSVSSAWGCSLFGGYPTPEAETGASCANGRDDDLDGRFDCADPSCDGSRACPESDRATCSDARDNDRDGRRDQEDVGCWRFVRSVVTRCESVGPARWRGSFRGAADGWRSSTDVEVTLDPVDPARDVASIAAGTLLGPTLAGGFAAADDPDAEAVLRVALEIDATSQVDAGLMVAGADTRGLPPDGIFIAVRNGDVGIGGSDERFVLAPGLITTRRWVDVALFVGRLPPIAAPDAGVLEAPARVWIEVDGVRYDGSLALRGFAAREPGEVPSAVVEGRPLVPTITAIAGTTRVGVTEVVLGRRDECGHSVPQIEATVRALARGADGLCAISEGDARSAGQPRVWASSDEAESFRSAGELGLGTLRGAGSTLLYEAGAYVGVLAVRALESRHIVTLRSVRGATCETLESVDLSTSEVTLALPGAEVVGTSPGLELRATAPRYRIWVGRGYSTVAAAEVSLLRYESDTGEPGTYEISEVMEDFPSTWFHEAVGGVQILFAGADRAFLLATDRGIDVIVEPTPGVFDVLPTPLLTASGRPGTFDELLVSSPTLMLDPPAPAGEPPRQTGLIAFTGETRCDDAADVDTCYRPTGVLRIELVPADAPP